MALKRQKRISFVITTIGNSSTMLKSDPKPPSRAKKKRQPLKRSAIKKKYNPSGEAKIFMEIWNEQPHICANCKAPLGDEPLTFNFAHIKPKGKYPELRLDKDNIFLSCFDCHYIEHNGTKAQYNARTR